MRRFVAGAGLILTMGLIGPVSASAVTITRGPGRDRLIGGGGRDRCKGGPGLDVSRKC